MKFRIVISLLVVALTLTGVSTSAAAEPSSGDVEWCYTKVLNEAEMGRGTRNVIRCFDSEEEMEAEAEGGRSGSFSTLSFSNQRLARHYDTGDTSGSSLSIYGTDCSGGGLSLVGGAWDQRIRSTVHGGCNTIRHYTTPSYGGSVQATVGSCGLLRALNGTLAGNVRSIRYYAPEQGGCYLG